MPIIKESSYTAPSFFKNRHIQTVYPSLFRNYKRPNYQRERVKTPDEDFIDLDWSKKGAKKLMMVLHGLEGSSDSNYAKAMIDYFNQQNWDAVAMNFRGCSGENNLQLRTYHMGATDDVDFIVRHIDQKYDYEEMVLIGFSLGGNVTLKYIGEMGNALPSIIKKGVAFSVPCYPLTSSIEFKKRHNYFYLKRFIISLVEKARLKEKQFPGAMDFELIKKSKNFDEFDNRFTAPAHGFKDVTDYYAKTGSRQFLSTIAVPTLLVNAKDDSFLSPECFPIEEAQNNPYFYLETPENGGHVGFVRFKEAGYFWSERRAFEFVSGIF